MLAVDTDGRRFRIWSLPIAPGQVIEPGSGQYKVEDFVQGAILPGVPGRLKDRGGKGSTHGRNDLIHFLL
jgi:hypothetical protein